MEQTTYQSRKRVNLKQNAKGNIQYEATVELFDKTNDEVITEITDLKAKLESALSTGQLPKSEGDNNE